MDYICGNAHKCADNRGEPMRCHHHKGVHNPVGDGFGCKFKCKQHTAKKDRPCVSITSKRGEKVLRKRNLMEA